MIFLEFYEISLSFLKFHENSWNFWNLTKISDLRAPWGARLFKPCYFLRNIKVSWWVADGWKHKHSRFSLNFIKVLKFPRNFIKSLKFLQFHQFSALRRWHAKRTVIPMVLQWLQRSCVLPGHPKTCFSWKHWFQTNILGFSWNFVKFASRIGF